LVSFPLHLGFSLYLYVDHSKAPTSKRLPLSTNWMDRKLAVFWGCLEMPRCMHISQAMDWQWGAPSL
jgi:hypothetical protein